MSIIGEYPDGANVSRRRLVQASGSVVGTSLAGCLSDLFSEPVPAGQLFVENRTNFPKLIALLVTNDTQNGDALINGEYRIPEWHALQFEGVLESEHGYDIRAYQPEARGSGRERLALDIQTCEADDPATQFEVSILASSNGPDILAYGCDETYNQVQSLTYVDPSEYRTTAIGADTDETGTLDADDADVSVSVVNKVPEDPGPFENESVAAITEQESDALALDGIIFQRAGQKGLVVSGDATNTSGRTFDAITVEVTLYDENDTEDRILDSTTERDNHGQLDAGETWQWAATFGEQPEFQLDSYAVTVAANYP